MSGKSLHLRQVRRPRRNPPRGTKPTDAQIARIDALTATGWGNWLVLLAYLAFALITTLGVQDIDFFVDSRQTQLPLVDVSIPTFAFFVFAPVLGAALYAYLHLHIRKMTEALAETPTGTQPLKERIKPWLLNDFVLHRRGERAIRHRPMDWLEWLTTVLLVWWSGPVVLGVMWVRTWPAHELWLSLLCAACMMLTLYAGAMSWTKMRQDLGQRGGWMTPVIATLVLLLALPVTWLTLANSKGIAKWAITSPEDEKAALSRIEKADLRSLSAAVQENSSFQEGVVRWTWTVLRELARLDAPDMTSARLSVLPPEEADPDTARDRYRKDFCTRRGIDAEICDLPRFASYTPPPHVAEKRTEWCGGRGYFEDRNGGCGNFFARLDDEFDSEWRSYRSTLVASISKPNFAGRDVRRASFSQTELSGVDFSLATMQGADLYRAHMEGADLSETKMQGANLSGATMQGADLYGAQMQKAELFLAQLQGADLSQAQMQGANLYGAQMQGASLFKAQLQGADLSQAQMQGANLFEAQMQGANLSEAHMEGADLSEAQMQGANLSEAHMEGADLSKAQMQGATNLSKAHMEGANLSWATMQGANLSEAQMQEADFFFAQMQGANLSGAEMQDAYAGGADFRNETSLTQAQLSSMIGDGRTLLPDTSASDAEEFFIPSCWTEPPKTWDSLVAVAVSPVGSFSTEEEMRDALVCAPGEAPRKTGTPWPLDKLQPWITDLGWQPEDRGPVTPRQ